MTAAAAVMSISFAALLATHVQFMRMFGLGLTLAVLVDATLVRMVLVPALMHLLGHWNYWAPRPLVRLHGYIGLSDSEADYARGYMSGRYKATSTGGIAVTVVEC
jgi:putative drug exporter of the RND superfamily